MSERSGPRTITVRQVDAPGLRGGGIVPSHEELLQIVPEPEIPLADGWRWRLDAEWVCLSSKPHAHQTGDYLSPGDQCPTWKPRITWAPERARERFRETKPTTADWQEVAGPEGLKLTTKLERDHNGRTVVTGLLIEGRPIRADDLREIRLSDIEATPDGGTVEQELATLPPLRRAPDMAPEEFSRLVAEHFRRWAQLTPHPAAEMAAKHGVKLPTMHTWVRDARLRGHLPAARRGKIIETRTP